MSDRLTPEKRSALMARVRTKNTAPELALRRALWADGVRGWRLHTRLPGRPDLAWPSRKLVVFVDGGFWHGHPDHYRPGQSSRFWDEKISRNRARDEQVNIKLRDLGWVVLRFWDFDIERDVATCVAAVREALDRAVRDAVRGAV